MDVAPPGIVAVSVTPRLVRLRITNEGSRPTSVLLTLEELRACQKNRDDSVPKTRNGLRPVTVTVGGGWAAVIGRARLLEPIARRPGVADGTPTAPALFPLLLQRLSCSLAAFAAGSSPGPMIQWRHSRRFRRVGLTPTSESGSGPRSCHYPCAGINSSRSRDSATGRAASVLVAWPMLFCEPGAQDECSGPCLESAVDVEPIERDDLSKWSTVVGMSCWHGWREREEFQIRSLRRRLDELLPS